MNKIWRVVRSLFGFAEKVHTIVWLLEIFGLMAVVTGVYAWVLHHIRQDMNVFLIGAFFVVGFASLTLPRLIYSLYQQRRQWVLDRREPVKIQTIDFEYMKDPKGSPLNNGWKWAEQDISNGVDFRVPHDAPITGSLAITASVFYGIDFTLHQNWILTDRLKYLAKYVGEYASLYAFVTIGFKDGTKDEQRWIAHKVGHSEPTPDGNSKHWVVFLQGRPSSNGWRSFDVSVSDEVGQIYRDRGGFLRHLTMLRLRGTLSISPIELYETGTLASDCCRSEHELKEARMLMAYEDMGKFKIENVSAGDPRVLLYPIVQHSDALKILKWAKSQRADIHWKIEGTGPYRVRE